jgi:WD40 repeat protein
MDVDMTKRTRRTLSRTELLLVVTPALAMILFYVASLNSRRNNPVDTPVRMPNYAGWKPRVRPAASHTGTVTAMAFSPDGRVLVSAGYGSPPGGPRGNELIIWAVSKDKIRIIRRFVSPELTNALAISPDGKLLAVGRPSELTTPVPTSNNWLKPSRTVFSGKVEVTAMRTGKRVRLLRTRHSVQSLDFSPDGNLLACGTEGALGGDGEVRVWNARTGKVQWVVPDSAEPRIREYNSSTGKTQWVAPNSAKLRKGSAYRSPLKRRNYSPWASTSTLNPPVQSVAFSPDGKTLATVANLYGRSKGTSGIHFWDARTGVLQNSTPDGTQDYISNRNEPLRLPMRRMEAA